MRSGTTTKETSQAAAARSALLAEMRALSEKLQRAQAELIALGGGALPGLHLVLEVGGRRCLLDSARVAEVVQLVATAPLPGAPPHVVGTFVYRGSPVVVVDFAALLQVGREPGIDAQIVVLAGAQPVGLLVDRVVRLVNAPEIFTGDITGDAVAALPEWWRGSPFLAGLCLDGEEVLPLLDPQPILAQLPRGSS